MTPEEQARANIDKLLQQADWVVQDIAGLNVHAASGVEAPRAVLKPETRPRLSRRESAQCLKLKMQQIQRCEAERYASASFQLSFGVAHALVPPDLWI